MKLTYYLLTVIIVSQKIHIITLKQKFFFLILINYLDLFPHPVFHNFWAGDGGKIR